MQSRPFSHGYNIAAYTRRMAADKPYRRAVVFPAGRDGAGRVTYSHLTFEQLDRESDRVAHGLVATGIVRGTRTILMVKPSLEFFILVFAMFKVGAVPVVVDPGMGLRRMLACFRESRPKAFIGIPLAHMVCTLFPRHFKSVRSWVTVGRRWFWGGATFGQLRQADDARFPIADSRKDETAAILFTTGSTGPAKGVVYTHANFDAQVQLIRDRFKIGSNEIDLPTFPLFALFDPALGMTAVIPDMDPTRPAQVNPHRIIEAITDHGVTNMFASPALLNRVGRFGSIRGIKLPTLKRVISAGAPVTPANMAQFSTLLTGDAQVFSGYGATEAMPVAVIGSRAVLAETRMISEQGGGTCIGLPIVSLAVSVINLSDDPISKWHHHLIIKDGTVGEIAVKGSVVTTGYYRRPHDDALSKINDDDAIWHRMGDIGRLDDKGRLWFLGRKSHRVITAKGPLYTIPCEAIFNNHPRVFRSALVGIGAAPHQMPVICIELEHDDPGQGKSRLADELLEMARKNPITRDIGTILFHDSFPVDIRHNSKIFREKLAKWAAQQINHKSAG